MDYLRIYVKEGDQDKVKKRIKLACPAIIKEAVLAPMYGPSLPKLKKPKAMTTGMNTKTMASMSGPELSQRLKPPTKFSTHFKTVGKKGKLKPIFETTRKAGKGLFNKAFTGLWVGSTVLDTLKYSPKGLPF